MSTDVNTLNSITIGGGLTVGNVGYGAMQLTGPKVWGEYPDHDHGVALLRRVVDEGVTFIDTADVYGPHSNEELIREALHPYPDDLVIATKGGFVRGGPEYSDMSAVGNKNYLRQAAYMSMRRLGLDHIDLYYLHTPTMTDAPFEEIIETLAGMRRGGVIRHIGLSNVSADQLRTALTITDIAAVTVHYNVAVRLGGAVRTGGRAHNRVLALASRCGTRRCGRCAVPDGHRPDRREVRRDPATGRTRLAAPSHTQRAADSRHDQRAAPPGKPRCGAHPADWRRGRRDHCAGPRGRLIRNDGLRLAAAPYSWKPSPTFATRPISSQRRFTTAGDTKPDDNTSKRPPSRAASAPG
jgi:diketogulonate reductase-like aldo/keto reductase